MLLFVATATYGQNYLMHFSQDIIAVKGDPDIIRKVPTAIPGDSLIYEGYLIETGIEAYYFDDTNICILYVVIHEYTELTRIIKDLNSTYERINELIWKYYTRDYVYTARMEYEDDCFIVNISFKGKNL